MIARMIVDAAVIGVPLDEWRAYDARRRAAITAEHNSRVKGKG